MNISRDKAIQAMDALTSAGFTAHLEAVVIPNHSPALLYRVSAQALGYDSVSMRQLCDLAETLELECVWQLNHFWFVLPQDELRHRRAIGAA